MLDGKHAIYLQTDFDDYYFLARNNAIGRRYDLGLPAKIQ